MRVKWIEHKGKKILFTDYSGVKAQDEMLEIMYESMKEVHKSPGTFLNLVDMTGAATGPDYMKEAKQQGKILMKKTEKSAMIGVTGLKGMLLKGYNLFSGDNIQPFVTKEEALDYLIT